jgi:hypothetical protein
LAVLILFFVSGAQTPSPLIRPADSGFGGADRGKVKGKTSGNWVMRSYYLDDCALHGLSQSVIAC